MQTTCPRCGWSNTRLSVPDGVLDGLARAILLAPIRCRSCRHRFYRFTTRTFETARPRQAEGVIAPLPEPVKSVENLAVNGRSLSSGSRGFRRAALRFDAPVDRPLHCAFPLTPQQSLNS